MVLARHLERIVQRTHVDVPRHLGVAFTHGREQRHEVEDRIHVVAGHDRSHGRGVEGVEHLERAVLAQRLALAHVGGDDIVVSVNLAQIDCQLGTDLPAGSYDQDAFHKVFIIIRK